MKTKITKHFYLSKKFLGLVIAFDCHKPNAMPYFKPILLIEFKLLFAGFYIAIDKVKI